MSLRSRLEALVDGLPDDGSVMVPVRWLREVLEQEPTLEEREKLFTVAELAERYGRAESTIRGWLAEGAFPGSFKLRGSSWRVPAEGVAEFERGKRKALGDANPPDLGAWRK